MAAGDLGEYLWVSHKERLVVVCMHRPPVQPEASPKDLERLELPEFEALAASLAPVKTDRHQ